VNATRPLHAPLVTRHSPPSCTSEGERQGTNLQTPLVREARLDGTYASSYAAPATASANA